MPTEYLTKEIAAKRSGRSPRRLLELAARGEIRKKIVQDPDNGDRRLALFHAGDIARLGRKSRKRHSAAAAPVPAAVPALVPIAAPMPQPVPQPRLWLTVTEAAEYSGLPPGFLRKRIAARHLPALDVGHRKGGRWRISRRDLEDMKA